MASSGNFCTLNPLAADDGTAQSKMATLSKGNLHTSRGTNDKYNQAIGTHGVATGKWYTEWYISDAGFPSWLVGWHYRSDIGEYSGSSPVSDVANICSFGYFTGSNIYLTKFGSTSTATLQIAYSSWTNQGVPTTGDVIMNCMDFDAGKGWWGINGVWGDIGSGAGDPANGTNPSLTWTVADYDDFKFPFTLNWAQSSTAGEITFNAGQDSTFSGAIAAGSGTDDNSVGNFKYSVPAGFLALSSSNLPISDDIDPAQTDTDFPQKNFNTITYTGNGSDGNSITGVGFQPDLVWVKNLSGSNAHQIYDSNRGTGKLLSSNNTDAEQTYSTVLQSFDSDGFTAGTSGGINGSGNNLVAWCWRANGGTTASNSNGSITSTVQANTKAGFSIATYTSPGSGTNHTVGHGLSGVDFIITKNRSQSFNWYCFHKSSPNYTYRLNEGSRHSYSNWSMGATTWGSEDGYTHNGTQNWVAYCWQNIEGMQKFGSYTGNGDSDGPFVHTGFRPRMLFTLLDNSTSGWRVRDTARSPNNPTIKILWWNLNFQEYSNSSQYPFDILSNGFKVRTGTSDFNGSGSTYFYGAWGDVPFKYNNTF